VNKELLMLTTLWYKIVSLDHHKDRDCHFHITETWSYGANPTYSIEHNGYIGNEIDKIGFSTRYNAIKYLILHLKINIFDLIEHAKDTITNSEGYHESDLYNAKQILEYTKELEL